MTVYYQPRNPKTDTARVNQEAHARLLKISINRGEAFPADMHALIRYQRWTADYSQPRARPFVVYVPASTALVYQTAFSKLESAVKFAASLNCMAEAQ